MSNSFSSATLAAAITLAMASSYQLSYAEEQAVVLDPLVVTASKSLQKQSEVPARVTVISQAEITKNPILNLSDLLKTDASIYVKQSGGIGQITEISLRGSNPSHVLVLKNGARLNNQNNLSPLYAQFIDSSDVSQIEVLKGPASVQYGSDAIAGVVNLIANPPAKTALQVTGVYGENNTYKTQILSSFVDDSGFYAQLGGQRLESDGTTILDTQDKSEKAAFDQKGYSAKVGYAKADWLNANIEISHNEGSNLFTYDYVSSDSYRNFENQIINANLSYFIKPTLLLSARYSNSQDKQDVIDYASEYNTENNEADLNLKWDFTAHQNLLFGVNYLSAEYQSNTISQGKQEVDSIGYYLQHQYQNQGFSTQTGVRIEDNERFGSHTVGQVAARYQLFPATSVYANIGTAFRAPSLNELYSQWGGNANLKPEESRSYEVGIDQKIGQHLAASFSAYHTEVKHLISYTAGAYSNIDKAKMNGAELGFKWQKQALYAAAQYAYVKTENETTGLEIAYRPRHTGTLTLGYDDGEYGVSAALIARSDANAENSPNSTKVAGYSSIDLNAFWNVNANLKLFTNIQNIGDVRYKEVYNTYPTTSWYLNGGRQASVGLTVRY